MVSSENNGYGQQVAYSDLVVGIDQDFNIKFGKDLFMKQSKISKCRVTVKYAALLGVVKILVDVAQCQCSSSVSNALLSAGSLQWFSIRNG